MSISRAVFLKKLSVAVPALALTPALLSNLEIKDGADSGENYVLIVETVKLSHPVGFHYHMALISKQEKDRVSVGGKIHVDRVFNLENSEYIIDTFLINEKTGDVKKNVVHARPPTALLRAA